jgi:hypothetical protein
MNLSTYIFEVNLINNPEQWSVDINTTRYVYTEKKMFSTYKEI